MPRAAWLVLLGGCASPIARAGRAFTYFSYSQGVAEMLRLASTRPDLASVSTAQMLFGLPTAGQCTNADGSKSACLNHIIEVTNRTSAASDPERPEVFISGALHGDERVGPLTALELARWLVERYDSDEWVRRLVDTRIVIIMPMTNAVGWELSRRDEMGIDPNRDFPYDQDARACMKSVCARAVNELYRRHLLQLVITFHGGMQAIGYNWGSFNYYRTAGKPHISPDDAVMKDVTGVMSRYAGTGGVPGNKVYPYGPMNDQVYPVHGGMEDWGYAASWDTAFVKQCTPSTNGRYDLSRTRYDASMVRALTILVETTDRKTPPLSSLGTVDGVYHGGGAGDGNVPRNMRLALAGIDLVQPHVGASRGPQPPPGGGACVPLVYEVWGTLSVDEAAVVWRSGAHGEWEVVEGVATQPGRGVWGTAALARAPQQFTVCVQLPPQVREAATPVLAVRVRADAAWTRPPSVRYTPAKPPQSHMANARTESWNHAVNGHRVRARKYWYSTPIVLAAADLDHGAPPPPPSPPPPPPPNPPLPVASASPPPTPAATSAESATLPEVSSQPATATPNGSPPQLPPPATFTDSVEAVQKLLRVACDRLGQQLRWQAPRTKKRRRRLQRRLEQRRRLRQGWRRAAEAALGVAGANSSMVLCMAYSRDAMQQTSVEQLEQQLGVALADKMGVAAARIVPTSHGGGTDGGGTGTGVLSIEVVPPASAAERSAQTLATLAQQLLRGGGQSELLRDSAPLRPIDSRVEALAVLGRSYAPSGKPLPPAVPATSLPPQPAASTWEAWRQKPQQMLDALPAAAEGGWIVAVSAAALVLALCYVAVRAVQARKRAPTGHPAVSMRWKGGQHEESEALRAREDDSETDQSVS